METAQLALTKNEIKYTGSPSGLLVLGDLYVIGVRGRVEEPFLEEELEFAGVMTSTELLRVWDKMKGG